MLKITGMLLAAAAAGAGAAFIYGNYGHPTIPAPMPAQSQVASVSRSQIPLRAIPDIRIFALPTTRPEFIAPVILKMPATQPAPVVVRPAVRTVSVRRGPIVECIACKGTIASNLDVEIKSRATGQVVQVGPGDQCNQFDVSEAVKKGDVLMRIDPDDETRAQQQAAAQVAISQLRLEQTRQNLVVAQQQFAQAREMASFNLDSADAQFQDARSKANRRKELLSRKLDTQEDYDSAASAAAQAQTNLSNAKVAIEQLKTQEYMLGIKQQDVKLADAQLHADQIGLDAANQRMAYYTLRAPIDGVITNLSVENGTIVFGGSTVMVVSDLSRVFVLAGVSEDDIGAVRVGQEARIVASAYPGVHFSGKVVRIAAEGDGDGKVSGLGVGGVTFEVKIEVTDTNKSLLRPRMTANVSIIRDKKSDVLLVPASAVNRKDQEQFVTIQTAPGLTKDVSVQVGLSDGKSVELVNGPAEGTHLVLAGAEARD